MKEFTTKNIKTASKVADGEEYIFTFTDCGKRFKQILVNYDGNSYTKTESLYKDPETGKALDTYYGILDGEEAYVIRKADGKLTINF